MCLKSDSVDHLSRRVDRLVWASELDLGSIQEQLLRRIGKRFREGLVFKAHRLVYHSTLDSRVIKKKNKVSGFEGRRRMQGYEVSKVDLLQPHNLASSGAFRAQLPTSVSASASASASTRVQ